MATRLELAQASPAAAHAPRPRASAPIKVVLADDHELVRRSMRLLLERESDVEVVAEARDLLTAMQHVSGHLQMPNGSSIEVIRRLRAQAPETEIVVATMEDSPVFARAAIDVGAVGYVLKDDATSELPLAIRCAARGEEYVSPRVAARLDALRRTVHDDGLSARETDVLRLIALGFTSAEISDRLHLSRRTVESHRRRIHRKLGLAKRSELVRYALGRHLIGD
jgi:two-component system, NarL family, response regulator NreC